MRLSDQTDTMHVHLPSISIAKDWKGTETLYEPGVCVCRYLSVCKIERVSLLVIEMENALATIQRSIIANA